MISKKKLIEKLEKTLKKEEDLVHLSNYSEWFEGFSQGVTCELQELIGLIKRGEFDYYEETKLL